MPFPLDDISTAFDNIAKTPRREGETAFPEIAVLIEACKSVPVARRCREERARQEKEILDARQRRIDHPEEYFHISEVLKEASLKKVPDVKTAV